jgi:hypothetical protein
LRELFHHCFKHARAIEWHWPFLEERQRERREHSRLKEEEEW